MGIIESTLLILLCLAPLALLFIGGGVFFLIKLGVIGKYWLKGDEVQSDGNYELDQSQDAGENSD